MHNTVTVLSNHALVLINIVCVLTNIGVVLTLQAALTSGIANLFLIS